MQIKTKVISIETIKPSSPTPKSRQKHQLSFLDQISLPTLSPLLFLYSSNPKFSNSGKSSQLKKSLSEVLSIYYPLAGRLVGNLYVDCNDAGVPFSEAEADCDVSQVVSSPNHKELKSFLPYTTAEKSQDLCMAVQATYFSCGGVAVGILLSHKIADGLSFFLFANAWSAVARNGGGGGVPLPEFDAATYAPPLDILSLQPSTGLEEEEVDTTRIFTFPASEIVSLRERYTAGGSRPRRVEALMAFVWAEFASITDVRSDPGKTWMVYNAANLRSRADPPLSEYHFGNLVMASVVEMAAGDGGVELLRKLRVASKALDAGYVGGLKNREMQLKEIKVGHGQADKDVAGRFFFSSLCGFPMYEADFGWGRPDRVRLGLPFKNVACFVDTKSGGGIEVLIRLTKQDMEKFGAHLMLKSNL